MFNFDITQCHGARTVPQELSQRLLYERERFPIKKQENLNRAPLSHHWSPHFLPLRKSPCLAAGAQGHSLGCRSLADLRSREKANLGSEEGRFPLVLYSFLPLYPASPPLRG